MGLDMERLGVVGEVLGHLPPMVQVGLTETSPHPRVEGAAEELGKMTTPGDQGDPRLQEDTGVKGQVLMAARGASNLEVPQEAAELEGLEEEGGTPTKSRHQLGARVTEGQLRGEDTKISKRKRRHETPVN